MWRHHYLTLNTTETHRGRSLSKMVKVSVIELTIKWDNRCAFYRIVFYSIHTVKLCLLLGITILQEVFLLARLRMRTPVMWTLGEMWFDRCVRFSSIPWQVRKRINWTPVVLSKQMYSLYFSTQTPPFLGWKLRFNDHVLVDQFYVFVVNNKSSPRLWCISCRVYMKDGKML